MNFDTPTLEQHAHLADLANDERITCEEFANDACRPAVEKINAISGFDELHARRLLVVIRNNLDHLSHLPRLEEVFGWMDDAIDGLAEPF